MNIPGLKYYGDGPHRIDDPEATLYEVLARRRGVARMPNRWSRSMGLWYKKIRVRPGRKWEKS